MKDPLKQEVELPSKGTDSPTAGNGDAKPQANGLGSDLNSRYDVGRIRVLLCHAPSSRGIGTVGRTIGVVVSPFSLPCMASAVGEV